MQFDLPNSSLSENDVKLFHVPNVLYENRYCDQDDFSILICGGENENRETLNDVYELKGPDFVPMKFPTMLEPRMNCETAVINSDIFVVGGYTSELDYDYNYLISVVRYSKENNDWCYKKQFLDKRSKFCVCSFKQNLYISGGWNYEFYISLSSCFVFNVKVEKWSKTVDMNKKRDCAAC